MLAGLEMAATFLIEAYFTNLPSSLETRLYISLSQPTSTAESSFWNSNAGFSMTTSSARLAIYRQAASEQLRGLHCKESQSKGDINQEKA